MKASRDGLKSNVTDSCDFLGVAASPEVTVRADVKLTPATKRRKKEEETQKAELQSKVKRLFVCN